MVRGRFLRKVCAHRLRTRLVLNYGGQCNVTPTTLIQAVCRKFNVGHVRRWVFHGACYVIAPKEVADEEMRLATPLHELTEGSQTA